MWKKAEIIKEEDGDQDRIRLQLQRISLGENRYQDPDDYVAKQALLLHGEGVVMQDEHQARLPQNVYEIPITENMKISQSINALTLQSDRALYHIHSNQKSIHYEGYLDFSD